MLLEIHTDNNILLVNVLACVEKPTPESNGQVTIKQFVNEDELKEDVLIDKWTAKRQDNPY